ncbi:hypothetical protein Mesau_00201 [Mesorhizobium australicum WSM2073]|uniref:Uncharacterized protein n=2 Tax=Phyllobacteriaceae TaxID=69277 RepID=L0KCG8_MESAW|nr:hypothetical protein Mesau_00201 [Mesorhizobium australicum WSM2073]
MMASRSKKSQIDKFRELAREIETVDSEEPLNEALRKVAKVPPPKNDKKPSDER